MANEDASQNQPHPKQLLDTIKKIIYDKLINYISDKTQLLGVKDSVAL